MSATEYSSGDKGAAAISTAAAVERLIGEALGICATVDPTLYGILSSILDLNTETAAADCDPAAVEPSDALIIALRMLMYAYIEEQTPNAGSMRAQRLELCITCVAERLELARASAPASRMLRC